MKIAFIIPSLINEGPVIVTKDIIEGLINKVDLIDVYYFDERENTLSFPCNTYRISFFQKIDFNKYDVVHTNMLRPDLYIWYHRKKSDKCKFVSTLHQFIYQTLENTYNRFIAFIFEKVWINALKKQDEIVYLTHIMEHTYKNRIKKTSKVIYNGRSFSEEIINAPVEEHSKLLAIKKQFKIIGIHCIVTKKNAISYLKYFDIYAATSYSEGFGLSLLEAGQCKLPTVCSNIAIFKELYNENEVVFYELDNIASLSEAIANAFNNKQQYAENIYKRAINDYSIENMSNQYLKLYCKN